jgi:hypothetical protein
MATLVLGAVGTALGGPIGGAIGALVGRQIDSVIFGSPNMRGPRLKELEVTTSSYGAAIPRVYGRMRVPGTMIWSTELEEHEASSGGGKQSPSLTSYNYSVSFAVALSSRPISAIGRIWADGKLLRGIEGDLKVSGQLRVHMGQADQPVDPLMLAAEGAQRCPAHRGIAYVVFEDLDLSEFYNRIPALTFEVLAGDPFDLATLVTELVDGAEVDLVNLPIDGLSCEGTIADTLELLAPICPVAADAGSDTITIRSSEGPEQAIVLPEAAVAVEDDAFGGPTGHVRRRAASSQAKPGALRYYDLDRDYLPGIQRGILPSARAEAATLDVPASMTAANARALIERSTRRLDWSRDRVAWRTAELAPGLVPGAIVLLPDREGNWRIDAWEWRRSGVEMELTRRAPEAGDILGGRAVDPGRAIPPTDAPALPTTLAALELPWDGTGSPDSVVTLAAASSATPAWKGCALYADDGSGALQPLGPSGKTRSITGVAATVLPPASAAIFDRHARFEVDLAGPDLQLVSATPRQLAQGANLALVGTELVQFADAVSLGAGRWRLAGFLRGRAGTEAAAMTHEPDEPFVLIDQKPRRLDAKLVGLQPGTEIVAVGLSDPEPVSTPILLQGVATRPLSPVHGRAKMLADGSLELGWVRRARGEWAWRDGVDLPLNEEAERYLVEFGPSGSAIAQWLVETSALVISASQLAELGILDPTGHIRVRQVGTRAQSFPLWLCTLAL